MTHIPCIIPVSYTHLDVYKRQAVTCTNKVKEIRVDYKKAAVLGEVLIPRVTKTGEDERTIVLAGEDKEIRAVVWLK